MSISNTIESYRKRRKRPAPIYIIGIIAVLLVVVGIFVLVNSLKGGVLARAFATKTLTPTITQTASNTPLPTETPTITLTIIDMSSRKETRSHPSSRTRTWATTR